MMSASDVLQGAEGLTREARLVAVEIVKGAPEYLSAERIANRTGLTTAAVCKAFDVLARRGLVDLRPSLQRDAQAARVTRTGAP